MATEKEMELAKQILAKLTEMETTLDKIDGKLGKVEDSLDMVDSKTDKLKRETSTSVDSKLDNLRGVQKGLQATFEQGFADVQKGLAEIKEKNKNRK
ncbi:hypothetical protein, partial [Priestia megaterium]|uniref:hypothetical protein n=1 Tax=Priestia megaterium TaxID=1404 RepID=UPI000BF9FF26